MNAISLTQYNFIINQTQWLLTDTADVCEPANTVGTTANCPAQTSPHAHTGQAIGVNARVKYVKRGCLVGVVNKWTIGHQLIDGDLSTFNFLIF